MNIYERFGRLTEQHDEEQRNHVLSLNLLRGIVEGKVDPARVKMNESGWTLVPVEAPGEGPMIADTKDS